MSIVNWFLRDLCYLCFLLFKELFAANLNDRIMNTFTKPSIILFLAVAACVLAGGSGCGVKDFKPSKIFSLDSAWPFDGDEEDEPEEGIPVRLVGAWTDTVMSKPGQPSQRGFGGRLMFYGEKNEKPILVEGQLVVYAFDEAGREPTNNKPTRRYVFPADQMKLHMSKSDIGATYSFWLPWDNVGGPKANVSLICRFEPKGGAVITGEQTRHILPGTMVATTAGGTAPQAAQVPEGEPMRPAQLTLEELQSRRQQVHGGAQLASYETPVNPPAAAPANLINAAATMPERQMTVTSISLPNNFQMPDAAALQAGAPPAAAVSAPRQMAPPIVPSQYQQPVGMQPMYPTPQPPPTNGASVMPRMPSVQTQFGMGAAQRGPVMPTVATQTIYAPPYNGLAMPMPGPQYVGQQQATMQTAQPMMATNPQQQAGMMLQQNVAASAQQVAVPAQQLAPQQAWQQMPAANGLRTAVGSPSPATIPWR
jgi:hypothetical protein